MAVPGKIYANINRIESTGLQATALSSTGINSGEEIITVAEAQAATEAEDADGFLNNVSQTDASTDDAAGSVVGRQPIVTLDVDIASIAPFDDILNNLPPPVKVDFPTITGPGTSTATSTSPPPPTRAVMNIYGDMARSAGGTPNPPPPSNESGTP
jgi:hypothetical protein